MADVIGLYRRAVEEFGARVRMVSDEQWSAPTPDADWDVRALVNHVLNENQWVPPLLEGLTIAEVGDRFEGDQLGADPYSAWTDVAVAALAACQDDDVPLRVVHVSFGDITGEDYLAQVTTDHVIHAWDLARATGGDEHLDPELVDFAYGYIAPQAEMWREAGAFGPATQAPAGADRQAELLALTGRDPLGTGVMADVAVAEEEAEELSGEDQLAVHLGLLAGQARTIQDELDSYLTTRSHYWDNKAEEWAADLGRYDRVIVGMAQMLGYPVPPHPPQGAQRRLSRGERAEIQAFLESNGVDLGRQSGGSAPQQPPESTAQSGGSAPQRPPNQRRRRPSGGCFLFRQAYRRLRRLPVGGGAGAPPGWLHGSAWVSRSAGGVLGGGGGGVGPGRSVPVGGGRPVRRPRRPGGG